MAGGKRLAEVALSSFEGTQHTNMMCFAQLYSEYHAVRRDEAIKRCTLKTTQKQSNVNFTIHIDSDAVNRLLTLAIVDMDSEAIQL